MYLCEIQKTAVVMEWVNDTLVVEIESETETETLYFGTAFYVYT